MRQLNRNKRREAYATFDASGNATAVIDVAPGPSWEIKQIGVSVTNSTTTPSCSTYVGRNNAGIFISSTLTGDSDTDSLPNVTLFTGESVCAVWSLGTVGSLGKMTIIYDEVPY